MYNMCDISNFKSIRFSIFCLSNFILYACIDVPYVCLPDQAITSGAFNKEGASLLISILGVSNTLGVVSGIILEPCYLSHSVYICFIDFCGIHWRQTLAGYQLSLRTIHQFQWNLTSRHSTDYQSLDHLITGRSVWIHNLGKLLLGFGHIGWYDFTGCIYQCLWNVASRSGNRLTGWPSICR